MIDWNNTSGLPSHGYQCGYCGYSVGSDRGYIGVDRFDGTVGRIYICPHCTNPTFFHSYSTQVPDVRPGNDVEDVPDDVNDLYDEGRSCVAACAYTASVLASRKLLMNIAVSRGAKEGLRFVEYVEYLANNNYVPPDGKDWVAHIRGKGNEATHEIAMMQREDAVELITLSEMLLKFIYEFPARVKAKKSPGP